MYSVQFYKFCSAIFWYRLLIWNANEIDIVLIAFQKNGKNTPGRLELLTSIFSGHLRDLGHQFLN